MRKRTAQILGWGTVAIFVTLAGWVVWEPMPPLRGADQLSNVELRAVKSYLEIHPPKRRPLTWSLIQARLTDLYRRRSPAPFGVVPMDFSDGTRTLYLAYPSSDQDVHLEVLERGDWRIIDASGKVALLGRLFQP
ncbi:hypothetical protein HNR46_000132 [Haloferula luteola]|uniref:Uncharacterized protein n=1 Tax=Haloferula luteola TaxID=595692 RepID=A0A840VAH5_9BACT|nr:hypothetical protein [Haloferula luteola]MBB5349911.1 hypothetical protein [Haloferula luteola]